jgi:hypothetical protein
MQTWILEHQSFILFILAIFTMLLGYNWGHHVGFIKGFQNGRRAGTKHPTRASR